MARNFKIKYAILPSRLIFNLVGPDNTLSVWKPPRIKMTPKMDENPFYTKLEQSILKKGIRNPILTIAGWYPTEKLHTLPEEMQKDTKKILVCVRNGGSRLWVAQKYNLGIPCLITEYNDVFSEIEEIEDYNTLYDYYKDKPGDIRVVPGIGIKVYYLPQIHLEEDKEIK